MSSVPSRRSTGSSLARRGVALGILVVAAWLVFKVVVGVVTTLATFLAIVLGVVALVWAVRNL